MSESHEGERNEPTVYRSPHSVPCPTCGAAATWPCVRLNTGEFMTTWHKARQSISVTEQPVSDRHAHLSACVGCGERIYVVDGTLVAASSHSDECPGYPEGHRRPGGGPEGHRPTP